MIVAGFSETAGEALWLAIVLLAAMIAIVLTVCGMVRALTWLIGLVGGRVRRSRVR
jgi:hypothetical protein